MGYLDLSGLALLDPLGDEESKQEDGDGADDGEDQDDTGLLAGPVALHQVGNGSLAARDERHIKGGHCCCGSVSFD